MKLSYEEKKKWVLDHQDIYTSKYAEDIANRNYNDLIKLFEKKTHLKYTPETYKKWQESIGFNGIPFEEIKEQYLKRDRDINNHLTESFLRAEESNHEEIIDGVSITETLKEIRYDHEAENGLFLFIKDGKLLDQYLIKGNNTTLIDISHQNYADIVNKANELGAGIFDVHNHPIWFAARPSENDIKAANYKKKMFEHFGAKDIGWGVVTEWDFYAVEYKKTTLSKVV